jgi:CBS domain-containing protein
VVSRNLVVARGPAGSRDVMRRVADVMHAPPVVVEASTTVQEASARMLDAAVHGAVVVEDGRICGLVTAEDVSDALAQGHDPTETLMVVIAERDPPLARSQEPLSEAHQRMRAAHHRLVPVVDSAGEPIGLLEDPEAGTER